MRHRLRLILAALIAAISLLLPTTACSSTDTPSYPEDTPTDLYWRYDDNQIEPDLPEGSENFQDDPNYEQELDEYSEEDDEYSEEDDEYSEEDDEEPRFVDEEDSTGNPKLPKLPKPKPNPKPNPLKVGSGYGKTGSW